MPVTAAATLPSAMRSISARVLGPVLPWWGSPVACRRRHDRCCLGRAGAGAGAGIRHAAAAEMSRASASSGRRERIMLLLLLLVLVLHLLSVEGTGSLVDPRVSQAHPLRCVWQ